MARETKVRTRRQDGQLEILMLITHPMETGQRVDKQTKEKIPAHYIKDINVEHNGKLVAQIAAGPAVSENPLLTVRVQKGAKGDKVKVSWVDNKGETGSSETVVDS